MLVDIKNEHRDARKHNFMVPYKQVELYEQTPEALWRYYVLCREWWREGAWTSQHMFVPIPPCVTYRASRLLSFDAAHPDSPFSWLVFESECVVLLFGRWCSDIQQRGLMRRLPQRGRAGLQTIGTDRLLRKSSISPTEVAQWLIDHDNHPWDKTSMSYQVRWPTLDTPAEVETINSFVRSDDIAAPAQVKLDMGNSISTADVELTRVRTNKEKLEFLMSLMKAEADFRSAMRTADEPFLSSLKIKLTYIHSQIEETTGVTSCTRVQGDEEATF
jgi:hypothetical protein